MLSWGHILLAGLLLATVSKAEDRKLGEPIKFAADFYTAVHEENPAKNVIISPLSLQIALGLLLMGADGNTADQITRGLYLHSSDRSTIASRFDELLNSYGSSDGVRIANKVYTKTGYNIHPEFEEVARTKFSSEAETIDFTEAAIAAETINSWVQNRTENKIKELFRPDQLSQDSRMVLVNAVHFKAAWEEPFEEEHTEKADFWVSETESVQVDMMVALSRIKYGVVDDLNAKVGFLPYKGTDLAMMILLPNSRTGLSELEHKLKTYDFSDLKNSLNRRWTRIHLPKFTIESTVDLKTVLRKMGMTDMFSAAADFPRLLESSDQLMIDDALQKAFINVDEKGTEAAAVTGAKAVPVSRKPTLIVDHPFFFAIVGSDDVLFVGSVRKP